MIKKVGKNGQMPADYKINMLPNAIIALIDPIMQEKCWSDLDKEKTEIQTRKMQPFHQFIYDAVVMSKGLPSIAAKTLYLMTNGLRTNAKKPYAAIVNRMLGFNSSPFRIDETQQVIRCHMLFKLV